MAIERRLISACGECSNYNWKKHRCAICSCKESDPKNPFYDDCPLPKGVEVCYCKDCKHYALWADGRAMNHCDKHDRTAYGNNFCSYGERKSGQAPQKEDV